MTSPEPTGTPQREPLEDRLARIAAKLAAAASAGPEPGRRAAPLAPLAPPLAEAEVAAFEERHGVRLPEEYRAFLTTIGNGGPGPYRGLEPLGTEYRDPYGAIRTRTAPLALAFPYGPYELDDPGWTRGLRGSAAYRGALWLNRQGEEEWFYNETARMWTLLVVSGPGRGRMVMVERDNDFFDPIYHPAPDFLAWYEEWLDRRAGGYTDHGPDDTDFDRPGSGVRTVLDHPDVEEALWAARITEVLARMYAHGRMPDWKREALAAAATGPRPQVVRAAAMWALARGCRVGAVDVVLPVLADPDPGVRLQAVRALQHQEDADPAVVIEALRPLLADPDPAVRADAEKFTGYARRSAET